MKTDPAYLDLLDTVLNLRSKLSQEETTVLKCKVRIHKLVYDLERCERYITYLENNLVSREDKLVSHEDEIERLKTDCQTIQNELDNCRDHLDLKEEALVAQDERIIQLETTVDKLKKQILNLSNIQNHGNKKADQESMSLPELFQNIGTALDQIERGVRGDTSIDPIITLNGVRITLVSVRAVIQRMQQAFTLKQAQCDQYQAQRDQYQNLLNTANEQITRLTNNAQQRVRTLIQERNILEGDREEQRRSVQRWTARCRARDRNINNFQQRIDGLIEARDNEENERLVW